MWAKAEWLWILSCFGFQLRLPLVEDGGQGAHGDLPSVPVEDLDEAAHVGAFEVVRQADGEGDRSYGLLLPVGSVEHGGGIAQVTGAHLLDGQAAVVPGLLGVRPRFSCVLVLGYYRGLPSGGSRNTGPSG